MSEYVEQLGQHLNELKQQLQNVRNHNERNRLQQLIDVKELRYTEIITRCSNITYIKDNVIDKIENDEWDIKQLKEEYFLVLIEILLNEPESKRFERCSLHALCTIFMYISKQNIEFDQQRDNESDTECYALFDKIKSKYSSSFDDQISELFIKLKQLISSKSINIESLLFAIILLIHLVFNITDENTTCTLCENDIHLLSNLCNLHQHIDVLYCISLLCPLFIFDEVSNEEYIDEIIRNLNLLITYDCDNILYSAINSYEQLFLLDAHIAPKLGQNKLDKKQFEQESELKVAEDDLLVTSYINKCYKEYKSELPPIALIKLIIKYFSPICRKKIKIQTLDPIQRFVELIIYPSDKVNTSIINLLYRMIVIGPVYIYLFDVNNLMINLMQYIRYSEKLIFKAFNLMLCCISFGDEHVMKALDDIDAFIECMEKTVIHSVIKMEEIVFSGIEELAQYYKNDNISINKLWQSLYEMEQNEKIVDENLEFIEEFKQEISH